MSGDLVSFDEIKDADWQAFQSVLDYVFSSSGVHPFDTFKRKLKPVAERSIWGELLCVEDAYTFDRRTWFLFRHGSTLVHQQIRRPQLVSYTQQARRYFAYISDNCDIASHQILNGLCLPTDHAFWHRHLPPNDWGCQCRIFAGMKRTLERHGYEVCDAPPGGVFVEPLFDDNTVPSLAQAVAELCSGRVRF